jgi:PAS domain S-box-containing protein
MDDPGGTRVDQTNSVSVDRDGVILSWGDAVTEVVGYSADEAIGESIDVIIPPALRRLHWWGFDQAMKTGRLNKKLFKVPAVCKDGTIIVAHANIDLTTSQKDNGVDGAVVTFVGVGPQWQSTAYRVALAPVDFARRVWGRTRANR